MNKIKALIISLMAAIGANAAILRTDHIVTSLMPDTMDVNIITPEGYTPEATFPTVYLLNGYSGNNDDWAKLIQPRLGELSDQYGLVLVMPDGRDSWYWDSPEMPEMKMESFMIDELVPYIDKHYPTIPDPKYRAITGLSMGGHGALWLAIRHSDIFGNAGTMSGGVDIRPFKGKWKTAKLLGDPKTNSRRYTDYTVMSLVPSLQPGQLNLIIDCGVDDFFAGVNEDLHKALLERKINHDYISRPGNHSRDYWANSILYHLLFFTEQFNKCN